MRERRLIGLGLLLSAATPARAECLGSCLDDMAAALASIAAYGVIGIVLLVMLIRAKWRRAGLWGLGIVTVLAVGVPLISQAWVGWKLSRMEAREIAGEPPALATRTPLLITPAMFTRMGIYVCPPDVIRLPTTRLAYWIGMRRVPSLMNTTPTTTPTASASTMIWLIG